MGSPLAADQLKIEIPPAPTVLTKMLETQPNTFLSDGNNNTNIDADYLSCDITLKELRRRSKKKRKLLESVGIKLQNISQDSHSYIKQEESDIRIKEEESDFEISLSAWKRKPNVKRKNRKQVNSSGDSVEINEQICFDSEDSTAPTSSIDEMHISVTGGDIEITEKMCIASEDSTSKTSNIDQVHMSVSGGDIESIPLAEDSSLSLVNESSFECTRFSQPISLLGERVNFGEIADMGFSHEISNSLPSVFELTKEVDVVKPATNHKPEEAFPAGWDLGSVVRESCKEYSSQSQPSSQMDCAVAMQLPDEAIYDGIESKELSKCVFHVKGTVFSNKDMPTHPIENTVGNFGSLDISFRNSYISCNPHDGGDPEYNGSAIPEQHEIYQIDKPMSTGTDKVEECLSMTSLSARNGFPAAKVFKSGNGVQVACVPRRLPSNRKAISPTSQERLRQAMDVDDLYSSLGNTSQVDAKSKNTHGTSPSVPKSILKAPLVSVGTPTSDCNGISFVSTCTQKAVAFSQRQMQDIESLTVKLMKELKSMKGVVEESLYSREYLSQPKYTIDEMRIAIQNAAEVEETTKRWLSMMARDCNRFCKIMRSSGKTTAVEKKKITFADEAGGVLCHVKIFDGDNLDSVSAPETEGVQ